MNKLRLVLIILLALCWLLPLSVAMAQSEPGPAVHNDAIQPGEAQLYQAATPESSIPPSAQPDSTPSAQPGSDETRCQVGQGSCGEIDATPAAPPSLYGPAPPTPTPAGTPESPDGPQAFQEGVVRLVFFWSDT